jgi:hypothetical protein
LHYVADLKCHCSLQAFWVGGAGPARRLGLPAADMPVRSPCVVLGFCPTSFASRRNELVAAEGVENERVLDGEALERLARCYQTTTIVSSSILRI